MAVNHAYLWFIVVISVLFIIAVLALGAYFLTLVSKSKSHKRNLQRQTVIQLSMLVVLTFPPMFLVKTALLLWAGLANGVVPLIVFSLLELFPSFGANLTYLLLP